jgi:V/A-type H+/Na+-transporting ATPase subunit I
MMLRPAAAQWFELLTSHEELGAVLDCIAATRSVQLQAYSQSETRLPLDELRAVLTEHETLRRRYGPWWPQPDLPAPDPNRAIVEAPQSALATLRAWVTHAEPIVAELETLALEQAELDALQATVPSDGMQPAAPGPAGDRGSRARKSPLRAMPSMTPAAAGAARRDSPARAPATDREHTCSRSGRART